MLFIGKFVTRTLKTFWAQSMTDNLTGKTFLGQLFNEALSLVLFELKDFHKQRQDDSLLFLMY